MCSRDVGINEHGSRWNFYALVEISSRSPIKGTYLRIENIMAVHFCMRSWKYAPVEPAVFCFARK